jgi:elongation factor G
VYDGKTHAVDGKEIAFFSAGRKAALEALAAAGPIVLEPMVTIEIAVGDGHVGAVTSEIATRNGHITRVETVGGDMSTLEGVAPLAELGDFGSRLKSLTAGGGSYNLSPSHYAPVAAQVQDRLAKGWERAEEEE